MACCRESATRSAGEKGRIATWRARSASARPPRSWRTSCAAPAAPMSRGARSPAESSPCTSGGGRRPPRAPSAAADDERSRLAGDTRGEVLCVRNQHRLARGLGEIGRRLDLRPHAPARELAALEAAPRILHRQPLDALRARRAPVPVYAVHVRDDREQTDAQPPAEQGGGAVLVDHRLDGAQAPRRADHRHAAASGRDDDALGAKQAADRLESQYVHGTRRRNQTAKSETPLLDHLPAEAPLEILRAVARIPGTDRLRRRAQTRV